MRQTGIQDGGKDFAAHEATEEVFGPAAAGGTDTQAGMIGKARAGAKELT